MLIKKTGKKLWAVGTKPCRSHIGLTHESPLCWRCQQDASSLLQIFWDCPHLWDFWTKVKATIHRVKDVSFADNLLAFLLHVTPMWVMHYKNALLKHFLSAAKAYILVKWKKPSPPTIKQWLDRADIQLMEQLAADLKEQSEKQFKIWTSWFLYGVVRPSGVVSPPPLLSTHHSFPGHCTLFFACSTENGRWRSGYS